MTHTKIQAAANQALQVMNAPPTEARIAVVAKYLAEFPVAAVEAYSVVHVVDSDGKVRLGEGDRPLTIRDLVEEILQSRDSEEARTLRWKEYGKSIVA